MNWRIINQPLDECDLSGGFAPRKKGFAWFIPLIAAAVSAASTAYGSSKSDQANKKARNELDKERYMTESERRRKLHEDYIDTAPGQNIIRQARDEASKIWKREQGAAAVSGSTDANTQMAKDAGNQMVGEAVANIAANDAARKDVVDAQYRAEEKALTQQQIALEQQRGQNVANAAGQISSALGSAAMSYAGTYMGAGSPGGTGVTAPQGGTPKLQQMETTPSTSVPLTPEMQMANYYKMMQGANQNYSNIAQNAQLWRNNWFGTNF